MDGDGDAPESEDESTDSSADDDEVTAANQQAELDIDAIVKTPRPNSHKAFDYLRIVYEEGQTPIEMPYYTALKL